MSLKSMTGFAAAQGTYENYAWSWDIRSVNAKGLDLRLRVPNWIEGFENALITKMAATLGRGNVTLALRLSRAEDVGVHLQVNDRALTAALTAISAVQSAAQDAGIALEDDEAPRAELAVIGHPVGGAHDHVELLGAGPGVGQVARRHRTPGEQEVDDLGHVRLAIGMLAQRWAETTKIP